MGKHHHEPRRSAWPRLTANTPKHLRASYKRPPSLLEALTTWYKLTNPTKPQERTQR